MSELESLPEKAEPDALDNSSHENTPPEAAAANSLDVVVDIDQIEQSDH